MAMLLLGILLMPVGSARAEPRFTEFTCQESFYALVDPGTVTYPGGNPHIRDMQVIFQETCTDPRVSGLNHVTLNINLNHSQGEGPVWGTAYTDNGNGGWTSSFSGYWYEDDPIVHGMNHGTGDYAGLHYYGEGGHGVLTGRIIEASQP
jgi:hypothetical protein